MNLNRLYEFATSTLFRVHFSPFSLLGDLSCHLSFILFCFYLKNLLNFPFSTFFFSFSFGGCYLTFDPTVTLLADISPLIVINGELTFN